MAALLRGGQTATWWRCLGCGGRWRASLVAENGGCFVGEEGVLIPPLAGVAAVDVEHSRLTYLDAINHALLALGADDFERANRVPGDVCSSRDEEARLDVEATVPLFQQNIYIVTPQAHRPKLCCSICKESAYCKYTPPHTARYSRCIQPTLLPCPFPSL